MDSKYALTVMDSELHAKLTNKEEPSAETQKEEWNSAEQETEEWPAQITTTMTGGLPPMPLSLEEEITPELPDIGTIIMLPVQRMPEVNSSAVTLMDTKEHATLMLKTEPDARTLMEETNTAEWETEEWPALIETTKHGGAIPLQSIKLSQLPSPQDGGVTQEESDARH